MKSLHPYGFELLLSSTLIVGFFAAMLFRRRPYSRQWKFLGTLVIMVTFASLMLHAMSPQTAHPTVAVALEGAPNKFETWAIASAKNGPTADLRQYRPSYDWDEIQFLHGYATPCDYGMQGYESWRFFCALERFDRDELARIFFLRQNQIVEEVQFHTVYFYFEDANQAVKARLPRDSTNFSQYREGSVTKIRLTL